MKLLAFSRTQAGHIFRAYVEATEPEIRAIMHDKRSTYPIQDLSEFCLFNLTKAMFQAEGRYRLGVQPADDMWDERPQWVIWGYQNDDVGQVLDKLGLRPPLSVPPGEVA